MVKEMEKALTYFQMEKKLLENGKMVNLLDEK
jgi:hypothetical protein